MGICNAVDGQWNIGLYLHNAGISDRWTVARTTHSVVTALYLLFDNNDPVDGLTPIGCIPIYVTLKFAP